MIAAALLRAAIDRELAAKSAIDLAMALGQPTDAAESEHRAACRAVDRLQEAANRVELLLRAG